MIPKGHAVACDPREIVLDDLLGEDHVGLCILYCLATMLIVMTIRPLAQIILDGYPFIEHLIAFNDTHVTNVDDVGEIGVKKKKNFFHKKKRSVVDSKGSISRIEKMLLKEFVRNVGVAKCCTMNCCQHFPCDVVEIRVLKFVF